MSGSFTNVYFKRTAGTPRACYVCHKPTPTVLATANTVDFIYVCDAHLKDPGFASRISDTPDITAEAIAKVKEEYDAAQKAKKKAADKGKQDAEDKEKEEKDGDGKDASAKDAKPPSTPSTPGALTTGSPGLATPKHEKYSLHRHVFSMRQDDHRRRRQASEAKNLAPRLPGAPSGGFGS